MKYRPKWSGLPPGRSKKTVKKPEDPGTKWDRIIRNMRSKGLLSKNKK